MRILDLIFPPCCANCGIILTAGTLCDDCRRNVFLNPNIFCGKCRGRMPAGDIVSKCHPRYPYALGAAMNYEGIPKKLIQKLKFSSIRDAARELALLMVRYWLRTCPPDFKADAIIPIPLSGRRLRERGFNQAELIANVLAAELHVPLRSDILWRPKNNKPQSKTGSLKERMMNIAGAFKTRNITERMDILLVDDVSTSGSTLFAASIVLKEAGVRRILALVAAKA